MTKDTLLEKYIENTGYGMDMWHPIENETMNVITDIIEQEQMELDKKKSSIADSCDMTKAEEIFYEHLNSEDVKHIADKSFLMDRVLDAINEALNHKGENDGLCECTDPCEKTLAMKCTGCGSLTECE